MRVLRPCVIALLMTLPCYMPLLVLLWKHHQTVLFANDKYTVMPRHVGHGHADEALADPSVPRRVHDDTQAHGHMHLSGAMRTADQTLTSRLRGLHGRHHECTARADINARVAGYIKALRVSGASVFEANMVRMSTWMLPLSCGLNHSHHHGSINKGTVHAMPRSSESASRAAGHMTVRQRVRGQQTGIVPYDLVGTVAHSGYNFHWADHAAYYYADLFEVCAHVLLVYTAEINSSRIAVAVCSVSQCK